MANNPLNNVTVYQAFLEILASPDAAARATQVVIEFIDEPHTPVAFVTQVIIEYIVEPVVIARVTQVIIEVIQHVGPAKVFMNEASNGDFAA